MTLRQSWNTLISRVGCSHSNYSRLFFEWVSLASCQNSFVWLFSVTVKPRRRLPCTNKRSNRGRHQWADRQSRNHQRVDRTLFWPHRHRTNQEELLLSRSTASHWLVVPDASQQATSSVSVDWGRCGFPILKAVRHWVIDAVRYWEVMQRDNETARRWVVIDKCFAQEAQSWELRAVRGAVSTMQRRSPPWRWGLSFARWVNCVSPTRSNNTERPCCKQCDQVWEHRKGSCKGTCRCSPNGA